MIYFDNVTKSYNGSPAIEGITFTVEPNEFVSIVGQSGAGKTTVVKMLLAEERPTDGSVFFDSININQLTSDELPAIRRRIGTVFQDFRLLPSKTVYENIAFAMEAAGRPDEEIVGDVPQILDLVGLVGKEECFPHQLSGGERQRVAIARAIVNKPDVIVADEPTGNLDPVNSWDIINLLSKINEMGTIIILATHDRDVINAVKRRVITIERGRIVQDVQKGTYKL